MTCEGSTPQQVLPRVLPPAATGMSVLLSRVFVERYWSVPVGRVSALALPLKIQTPFCDAVDWFISRMRRKVALPVDGTVTPSKTFVPGLLMLMLVEPTGVHATTGVAYAMSMCLLNVRNDSQVPYGAKLAMKRSPALTGISVSPSSTNVVPLGEVEHDPVQVPTEPTTTAPLALAAIP
jgi:hypothetical protein